MALALTLTLAQAACVSAPPPVTAEAPSSPVQVSNGGQPYQMWEGASARQAADAQCGPRGVRTSIYDRFDQTAGVWVYPRGCA